MAAILATGAASAAANVLVVRSSGPSAQAYPPGKSLPDNAALALRAGDTLVVLDGRGTRTFRGPGNFNPSVAAQTSARTVVANNGRRARIGAVRSAPYVPNNRTNIWHLDVAQSGNLCLAEAGPPTLWRADAERSATVSIAGPDGAARQLSWPAGAATATWPADLPIAEGTDYRLQLSDSPAPATVRFKRLQSQPGDVPAVAAALIEAGCQEQLDLLVDSVAQN
ncbi:hypothetical protein [Sphingosinicella terrae]|uniref:hypothetical protein n=1 Tax=Sphingosinicella terrae TaxID=2172047 RepID=UPI000E0E01CA|nr:hypothetical protein [Sphingosinicella terrae]